MGGERDGRWSGGSLIVGGLYLLNEAMGRVVVRMAAGPAAVVVGGVVLNVLYWAGPVHPCHHLSSGTTFRAGDTAVPARPGR